MPIELHGTFWTIQEMADELDREYSGVSRVLIKSYADKMICVGAKTYLIPDDVAQIIFQDFKNRHYPLPYVARQVGAPGIYLVRAADAGFPHQEGEDGPAFKEAHIAVLKVAWDRVSRNEQLNKADRVAPAVELALQILKKLEETDDDSDD